MKKHTIILFTVWIGLVSCSSKEESYMDSNLDAEKRVTLLLPQMTLEEKIGQMSQFVGLSQSLEKKEEQQFNPDDNAQYKGLHNSDILEMIKNGEIGSFLKVSGPDEINLLQAYTDSSRLRIPLLIATDAIHGHGMYKKGATIFPTALGLSCSFDTTLVRKVAQATAAEMRATGYHWTFSPNVDVVRDPRWGRSGETFGEDPFLVGEMGIAMIKGYQGNDFSGKQNVLACAKHLAAGGDPNNGLNIAPMDVSDRTLNEIYFPPFIKAVNAGAYTFMAAHNEINGVPCHSSHYLNSELLRDKWGFEGFVVSDWKDIERLHTVHGVAATIDEAFLISVKAGIDVHMHGPGYVESIKQSVLSGKLDESLIDKAVSKILYAKFKMGLFENRYIDPLLGDKVILNSKNKQLSLEAAKKSIVLLKNNNQALPLSKNVSSIFITGPNANDESTLGDWAIDQPNENVITVLEGIQQGVSEKTKIDYFDCGTIRNINEKSIEKAAKKAAKCDVAIIVVGENAMRYRADHSCGENVDRTTLNLIGNQQLLINRIHKTGVPVILVYVNGRPLATTWNYENIDALIEAWEPGIMGGTAIADVIFGNYNPSGKLTTTIPRSVGHIQQVYNHRPSQYVRNFTDDKNEPSFEFGYGLSYSTFEYSNLVLPSEISMNDSLNISCTIKNTGAVKGDEVVLLFIHDKYASVTTRVKELKGFKRISLNPNEEQNVSFSLSIDDLAILNNSLKKEVESGAFEVFVGLNKLKDEFHLSK